MTARTWIAAAFAALTVLAGSVHAAASVGLVCEGVDTDASVSILLGAGLMRTPLAVTLSVGGEERRSVGPAAPSADALLIGQSWLDRSELRLDLLDIEGRRYEARLRLRFVDNEDVAVGTLVLGRGRVVEVACRQD